MANSDSEDFESADENLELVIQLTPTITSNINKNICVDGVKKEDEFQTLDNSKSLGKSSDQQGSNLTHGGSDNKYNDLNNPLTGEVSPCDTYLLESTSKDDDRLSELECHGENIRTTYKTKHEGYNPRGDYNFAEFLGESRMAMLVAILTGQDANSSVVGKPSDEYANPPSCVDCSEGEDEAVSPRDYEADMSDTAEHPTGEDCWEVEEELDDLTIDETIKENLDFKVSTPPVGEDSENKTDELNTDVNDENKELKPVLEKLADDKPRLSWGRGASLVSPGISIVTGGVSSLMQGLTSALETGIGAPDPEQLARLHLEEEQPEQQDRHVSGGGGLLGLVSGVLTGGLDTLEMIGKKTMEVLQEGDPGLKKKRALFSHKENLSQLLREAKERAENEDKLNVKAIHFETLFDDCQGLVHLEALEMLSKQCDMKMQAALLLAPDPELSRLQDLLQDLKQVCQLPDEEDEEEEQGAEWRSKLEAAARQLGVGWALDKLATTWADMEVWLGANPACSAEEAHRTALTMLARLCGESVEQFHKVAELLLVQEERRPQEEAGALVLITGVLSSMVGLAATRFSEHLNSCEADVQAANPLITNVFFEAANSSSYIQEAFQLMVPVLQVGLIPGCAEVSRT